MATLPDYAELQQALIKVDANLEAAEADVKKVIELSDDPEQIAWAEGVLEKLAPTPTPEPTATPPPATIPSITDFDLYEHDMDCTIYSLMGTDIFSKWFRIIRFIFMTVFLHSQNFLHYPSILLLLDNPVVRGHKRIQLTQNWMSCNPLKL